MIELAEATGTDPALAGLAALVTSTATIGNRAAAFVKGGWTEASVLWGGIIARSGTVKSAVLKLATAPVVEVYKAAHEQFVEDLAAYDISVQKYEVERKIWEQSAKKGHAGDPPLKPDVPLEQRLVVSDVTTEKLALLLQENPLGLLLVRDELAAWHGSFDRYSRGKGSDAPTWLSFYDGAMALVDRRQRRVAGKLSPISYYRLPVFLQCPGRPPAGDQHQRDRVPLQKLREGHLGRESIPRPIGPLAIEDL